ncbi:MAG: right-handed parallel beta-helix repeat-containing protein [Bacteroidales bacterium]|nr:right-handed parallel beta-helix repeat-containing protein [Bacteroidales bacterium]
MKTFKFRTKLLWKILTLFSLLTIYNNSSDAQSTIHVGGSFDVPDIWDADTVKVYGNIEVDTLTILAGTVVKFQGYYSINSKLNAMGACGDTIYFTMQDTTGFYNPDTTLGGWHGITVKSSSRIDFCKIQYVKYSHPVIGYLGAIGGKGSGSSIFIFNTVIKDMHAHGIWGFTEGINVFKCIIENLKGSGIVAGVNADSCIIRNNSGFGIYPHLSTSNNGNCRVTNCVIESNTRGISIRESNIFIIGNIIQNNSEYGIYSIENAFKEGLIANNIIRNNGTGIYINESRFIEIINNLIYNNKGIGISIQYYSSKIINNTIVKNSSYGIWAHNTETSVINNIIRDNGEEGDLQIFGGNDRDSLFHGNIYNSNITDILSIPVAGIIQDNIDADPQFVDTTNFDFHLSDYSPCINAGKSDTTGLSLPATDLDGNPRIFDGRVDIGAYEYQQDNFHILQQPTSQTVCEGTLTTIETDAIGGVIGYQWQKNSINIPSANQRILTFDPVNINDDGFYNCLIIADDKTVSTDTVLLSVDISIEIENQTISFSICPGKDTLLFVQANSAGLVDYSWSKNGQVIPDASESELTIPLLAMHQQNVYRCTLSNECGSITSQDITVTTLNIPDPPIVNSIEICEGDSIPNLVAIGENIKWYSDADLKNLVHSGNSYKVNVFQPGIYTYYAIQTISNCESMPSVATLTINQSLVSYENITICEGNNYLGWTEYGEYVRTLISSSGCDSIVTTNLFVNPSYNINESIAICEGSNYLGWTESGVYVRNLFSSSGCDSILTTNLVVYPSYYISEYIVICEGDSYKGWSETGKYTDTLTTINGCDSTVATNLGVNPNHYIHENISICEGENYHRWTRSGQYSRNYNSVYGCDSIITTNLVVNNLPNTPNITQFGDTLISSEIYGNQWYYNSNEINGATDQELVITESGDYFVIVTDGNGCISNKSNTISAVYTYLKSIDENKIRIHPNPMKEYITIEGLPNSVFEVAIYDIYGTLLISQNSTPFVTKIDISGLPKGMYIIVLQNQKSQSVKIIKH